MDPGHKAHHLTSCHLGINTLLHDLSVLVDQVCCPDNTNGNLAVVLLLCELPTFLTLNHGFRVRYLLFPSENR